MQKSKYSASLVETRKKGWDEINATAGKIGKKGTNMFAGLEEEDGKDDKDDWEEVQELDDEMAEAEPAAPVSKASAKSSAASAPAAAPPPVDEDEDIL